MADDFGDEDPTIMDGAPLVDDENETPPSIPRCTECGSVVFFDDFTPAASVIGSSIFSNGQCVRARDGHWWHCANYSKERTKLVILPPR